MKYERYREILRKGGMSEAEIEAQITILEREKAEVARGVCPKCGAPIAVYREAETNPMRTQSLWVQYRCSRDARPGIYQDPKPCGFMLDRLEAN